MPAMHARGRRGGRAKDVTLQVQLNTHGPSHCPLWVTCCCQGCPWSPDLAQGVLAPVCALLLCPGERAAKEVVEADSNAA